MKLSKFEKRIDNSRGLGERLGKYGGSNYWDTHGRIYAAVGEDAKVWKQRGGGPEGKCLIVGDLAADVLSEIAIFAGWESFMTRTLASLSDLCAAKLTTSSISLRSLMVRLVPLTLMRPSNQPDCTLMTSVKPLARAAMGSYGKVNSEVGPARVSKSTLFLVGRKNYDGRW